MILLERGRGRKREEGGGGGGDFCFMLPFFKQTAAWHMGCSFDRHVNRNIVEG